MKATKFPLTWPPDWPRTESSKRIKGQFRAWTSGPMAGGAPRPISVIQGAERVVDELGRLGVRGDDIIISTNIAVRLDGYPRSDRGEPGDPGVAVYWEKDQQPMRCMPIDHYTRVADNLAAVAATLEDLRSIERHGGAPILDRAFAGFIALPAPGTTSDVRPWHVVLEVSRFATADEINLAYRRKVSALHSGRPGGDHEASAELNMARDQARRERGLR